MIDEQRIKNIAASLSFSPLPRDTTDWMHEPGLRLLTEHESDSVVSILEKLQDIPSDSPLFYFSIARLRPAELSMLETFIAKSYQGMERMKAESFPSVFAMNLSTRAAA